MHTGCLFVVAAGFSLVVCLLMLDVDMVPFLPVIVVVSSVFVTDGSSGILADVSSVVLASVVSVVVLFLSMASAAVVPKSNAKHTK